MVHLKTVNPDNWRLGLHVRENQRRYAADSSGILARAYAYRESRSRAFIIYDDDTPVGMALYYDWEDAYNFSQFFIDERYQGKGLGYEAARLVIREMEKDGVYHKVVLCYVEGDEAAERLYRKLGFSPTGEKEEDEIVMEKQLR